MSASSSSEFVMCFKYIVPAFVDKTKSIFITALMSAAPEKHSLPHELNIDGTVMVLKAVGEVTGLVDDTRAKFTLYPIDIENPTNAMGEEVITTISPQSVDFLLSRLK